MPKVTRVSEKLRGDVTVNESALSCFFLIEPALSCSILESVIVPRRLYPVTLLCPFLLLILNTVMLQIFLFSKTNFPFKFILSLAKGYYIVT